MLSKLSVSFIPPEQNAGQYHNLKIGNKSFGSVEQFKHLSTTPTNQNGKHEEIKAN